ncbi:MAG: outer membrane protein assembly factor BamA [Rhodospirillales bacterium]|nr:outer membrane protein assembly factor BamA [Alphaproteobacteria bacterium]MCB9987380.1 outer membrane protein assembly factor BamA [Rhodospirillales bacterium]USO07773.1 MAG: outer membrane protein assembly factor BamA [Rhodospirillales bacterium]
MKKGFRYTLSALALVLTVTVSPISLMAQEAHVARIQIEGAERIDPQTILSYMTVKPGDTYSQEALSDSAKALYGTGLFADVNIQPRNGVLVVSVVENPLINQIAFEGNEKLKDEELMSEIASRSRNVLARTTVQSDVDRIRELYRRQGRYSVAVEPKVIRLDQNRVNLVFEINEGPVSEIRGIKFVGNQAYSDDALREAVASKESRWYRFLSTSDRYDADRMAYDEELLRRFYLKHGYIDFRVVSAVAELTPDKSAFFLTFTVDEGPRYKIGKVNVDTSGLTGVDPKVLDKDIEIKSGQWYDAQAMDDTISAMTTRLGDMQYAFVGVDPDVARHPENDTVDVTFRVGRTPKVYVERIDIKGNVRTQDKVVRRAFPLAEGDPFNGDKIAKAEQNLKDLDFFDTVKVRPVPGSAPDQTVVDVDVQEKSTGEISLGGGFSTSEGPLADFQIRERNFLGRGQDVALSASVSAKHTEFDTSFTEPYFLDRDLSAGVDAFHTTSNLKSESSFDQVRTGGALRLGYPLSEHLRQTLKYRLENNDIKNVQSDASAYIKQQEGTWLTSAVSQRLTYDTRDSTLWPTKGQVSWLETEGAGLGGDAKFISGKIGAEVFFPVTHSSVLSILGEGGAIHGWSGSGVRINERYFIGGDTLRGFQASGIGPRDLTTGDALGGNLFYRGSVEAAFPIGLPEEMGVQGHAFSDFGSLWSLDQSGAGIVDSKSVRVSTGVGVSWRSPFGLIRLDFANPVVKENYDKNEKFRFSFGTRF